MLSLTVFLLIMIINSKSRLKRTLVNVIVCMDFSNACFPCSKTLYSMIYILESYNSKWSQYLLITVSHAHYCRCEPEDPFPSRHEQFPITFLEVSQNFSVNNRSIFKLKNNNNKFSVELK